jgi:hypothetical protein
MKSRFVNKETEPWPAFMNEDPIALRSFSDVRIAHPEYGLIAYDAGTPDRAVARAFCVPSAWDGDPALGGLPADGWDGVIWRSARDRQIGRKPNLVSALEITVPADLQGTGLSGKMLAAMRDNAARLGFEHLVAPVRPNRKHLVPDVPIEEYAALVRQDGLPQDPWLRVHVPAGSSAPASARWSSPAHWTSGVPGPACRSTSRGRSWCPARSCLSSAASSMTTRSTSSRRCGDTTGCEPGLGLTGRSARRSLPIPIVQTGIPIRRSRALFKWGGTRVGYAL